MSKKMSKVWAYGVAYTSLALGSGVSIAGNVADTYRISGPATDTLDIALAAFWPAAVLLAIEMFVSTLWSQARGYQVLRWIGSIGIGFMAMRVSWIHLNELLASRGQTADVATLGPLAIDGLAIMATALILSGRRAVANVQDIPAPVANVHVLPPMPYVPEDERPADVSTVQAVRRRVDDLADVLPDMATVSWTPPAAVPPLADDLSDAASFWTPERQAAYRAVATDTAVPAAPVVPGRSRRLSLDDRRALSILLHVAHREGMIIDEGHGERRARTAEVDEILAAYYDVSTRTIRRARTDAGISPVSAPPAGGVN